MVVRVGFGRDAVSARIAVKLPVAAEASDRAEASSEATFELALDNTAPADSVAAAMAELARATTLLASEAAPEIALAASELALPRTLRISDSLAEIAADTDAARVKRADSALLAAEAALVASGIGRNVIPSDAKAAAEDDAASAAASTREMTALAETLITAIHRSDQYLTWVLRKPSIPYLRLLNGLSRAPLQLRWLPIPLRWSRRD